MKCLELPKTPLLFNMLLKIPVLAEFSHDIDIIFGHENLNGSKNVRMRECSKGVYLVIEQIFLNFALNFR